MFVPARLFFAALCVFVVSSGVAPAQVFAQATDPIEVADVTVRIAPKSTETLYYAFAAGDRLLFSFTEDDHRELHSITITAYPTAVVFRDADLKRADKNITVSSEGIYAFAFENNQLLASRTGRVRIQRIPASTKSRAFATSVELRTKTDTVYTYDPHDYTVSETRTTRRVVASVDTSLQQLFDRTERVGAKLSIGGAASEVTITFKLPTNITKPNETTEVVSWAYWLGVGQESGKIYTQNTQKTLGMVSTIAKFAGQYGALASLAIDGVSMFSVPTVGDNVLYNFTGITTGGSRVKLETGNGIQASAKNSRFLQGDVEVKLTNDNYKDPIDVNLKAVAIVVRKVYEDRTTVAPKYTPKRAGVAPKLTITATKVPVMAR